MLRQLRGKVQVLEVRQAGKGGGASAVEVNCQILSVEGG